MPDRIRFSEDIIVGAQPSEAEIRAMCADGIKGIINLRTAGEEMQPLSPEREGEIVRKAGLEYVHIPVAMGRATPELVDRFRSELSSIAKPVFVHCKLGKRAGAFTLMHAAAENGWSADEALKKAESMGCQCEYPRTRELVRSYLAPREGEISRGNPSPLASPKRS